MPILTDIFISYARVDDERLPGTAGGWVSTFVDGLKTYLAKQIGRREAFSFWMDYEDLRGNEPLEPVIRQQLAASQALVLFLSPGYVTSRWCREELKAFVERVGAGSRLVFPVYLSPVDRVPEDLADLVSYRFWVKEQGMARTLGDPQPDPTERAYYDGLRRLARDLADTLRGIQRRAEQGSGLSIFLNGGQADIDLIRRTAARLAKQGLSCVLPITADGGASADPADIRRDLNENLDGCDAVLLLFENGPRTQVRHFISEYRRSLARRDVPPVRFALCQTDPDPLAVGMAHPDLEIIIARQPCDRGCVDAFLAGLQL
jgi:hypothetical protein